MSNPTPILNNINAFDATKGTTISFNIIGGTDIVRSNIVYIYDLSTNDLICTHLYISTESIHELPPNTDPSIVYASGKSSADFVNNKNYYLQIQTFTNTAGTAGGSGMSVAKTFWCLFNPALSVNAIPAAVSTTSYNVGATYTTNITDVTIPVTNIIQQYKFDLYTATGTLVQTSGNIIGSGEQEGTSTTYNITYNFSGLVVNNSYYVIVTTTSTEGMTVSAQSNTFTVSIDTPTLGEATVVNNACDGYISVTSNLSGEYGGSASGEIATFETDSVNDVSSLKVTLTPQQDGTPWIGTDHDTTPYLHRAMPTQSNDYNRESGSIVGGTVAWNQLVQNGNFANNTDWGTRYATISIADGIATFTPESEGTVRGIVQGNMGEYAKANHKYLGFATVKPPKQVQMNLSLVGSGGGRTIIPANVWTTFGQIFTYSNPTFKERLAIYCDTNLTTSDTVQVRNAQLFDLTAMFGATIADYIYSLEQATAGAGVAWFKKLFPKDYYAYDAGTLKSVEGLQSHDTVGFNLWGTSTDNIGKTIGYDGSLGNNSNFCTSDYIRVLPSTTYYFKNVAPSANALTLAQYDSDKNFIKTTSITGQSGKDTSGLVTMEGNTHYIRCQRFTNTTEVCINLNKPTGTPKNGDYVPYVKHTYALDSDLVLRGIPKLDSNNNLYYDGDTYASDGTVTRKYGIVDLGTLNWAAGFGGFYSSGLHGVAKSPTSYDVPVAVCSKYSWVVGGSGNTGFFIHTSTSYQGYVIIVDPAYTDAATFKTAMSGVYLVYELATPTTETADPFTNPQEVDSSGTEEYVGSPIPVGHKTTYQRICPITGWTGCEVDVAGVNVWDEDWEVGRINSANGNDFNGNGIRSKNYIPVKPSTVYHGMSGSYTGATAMLILYYDADKNYISYDNKYPISGFNFTTPNNARYIRINVQTSAAVTYNHDISINYPSTDTTYHAYQGTTYPVSWQTEAGTVYGGTVDLVSGELVIDNGIKIFDASEPQINFYSVDAGTNSNRIVYTGLQNVKVGSYLAFKSNTFAYELNSFPSVGFGAINNGNLLLGVPTTVTTKAEAIKYLASMNVQIVYPLATPQTIQLTPQEIRTLLGTNNVWSDSGDVEITYNIPITNLLVKRQDVADVSGTWLTLYSQSITQASDMDFTFIDFLNQHGKTYRYALVPLLTQQQGDVDVEIEGGYTVSDDVLSVFDGVFIANGNGSQKLKAATEYGDLETNQDVGVLTTIGGKYPFVVSNSNLNYHSGSISALIVPSDFYINGDLDRLDIVERREAIEQFLTDKTAKILKDWNGNIWLITFVDNVEVSFADDYGMGLGTLSAKWVEIGDVNDQTDLQQTGLI